MTNQPPREPINLWVYICKNVAGAEDDHYGAVIDLEGGDCIEKPMETWEHVSYWAVAFEDSPLYPAVFCNMYFEGDLPRQRTRDRYHAQLQAMIGPALFDQDPLCPRCRSANLASVTAIDIDETGEIETPETAYVCENCGWSFVVRRHMQ